MLLGEISTGNVFNFSAACAPVSVRRLVQNDDVCSKCRIFSQAGFYFLYVPQNVLLGVNGVANGSVSVCAVFPRLVRLEMGLMRAGNGELCAK